ncbi:hypothetical protein NM688_g4137 [Phlebia brevispora]|uniref:Uncharacterized protein n=1 Tax=Phlebia brevispora TaxID=194682 RepID=A0ACC1T3X8_9APHY|nr:hypothetical protein NM688_g4137 [Phlebia brevispora]
MKLPCIGSRPPQTRNLWASYRFYFARTVTMSEIVLKTIVPAPLMSAWGIWLASSQLCKGATHRQKQLGVLLFRCRDIVQQLAEHFQDDSAVVESMAAGAREVEEACTSLNNILSVVTEKGLLWCLTHARELENDVENCERRVDTVSTTIHHMILRNNVQRMADARKRDQQELTQIVSASPTADQLIQALRDKGIREKTSGDIIDTLRNYVRECPAHDNSLPEDVFIHKALDILAPPQVEDTNVLCIRSADVDVDLTNSIGRGASGQVYIGRWNGAVVAIKRMYPEDARIIQGMRKKSFDNEVRIWSGLHHPNILELYGICTEAEVPFILMRYCQFGTISQYLIKHPNTDRARLASVICPAHEVAVGLAFLHSKDIVHGDVKCANILISDDYHALLADFGLSIKLCQYRMRTTYSTHMNQQRGTPLFMAPEVLLGGSPAKAADVYSLSLAIWELFHGDVPYRKFLNMELLISAVVSRDFREEFPGTCTPVHVWDVIQRCWVADPHARPTAEEARQALDPARYSDSHRSASQKTEVNSTARGNSEEHGIRPAPEIVAESSQAHMERSDSNNSVGTLVETPLSSRPSSVEMPSLATSVDIQEVTAAIVASVRAGTISSERLDPKPPTGPPHHARSRSRSGIHVMDKSKGRVESVPSEQNLPAVPGPTQDSTREVSPFDLVSPPLAPASLQNQYIPHIMTPSPSPSPPRSPPSASYIMPPPRMLTPPLPIPMLSRTATPPRISTPPYIPSLPHHWMPSTPILKPTLTLAQSVNVPKRCTLLGSASLPELPVPVPPPFMSPLARENEGSSVDRGSITKMSGTGLDGSKQRFPWDLDKFLQITDFRNSFAKGIDDFDTFLEHVILDGISIHANVQKSLESVNVRRLVRLALYQHVIYCDDSTAMNNKEEFAMAAEFTTKIVYRAMWLAPNTRPSAEVHFVNDDGGKLCGLNGSEQSYSQIKKGFRKVQSNEYNNLGTGLRTKVLQPFVYEVLESSGGRLQRPLLITVVIRCAPFPETRSTFRDAVVECKRRLVEAGYKATHVLFNVYAVNNLPNAYDFMEELRGDVDLQDVLSCVTDDLSSSRELSSRSWDSDRWILDTMILPIERLETAR